MAAVIWRMVNLDWYVSLAPILDIKSGREWGGNASVSIAFSSVFGVFSLMEVVPNVARLRRSRDLGLLTAKMRCLIWPRVALGGEGGGGTCSIPAR
jgi:hypothetical protein